MTSIRTPLSVEHEKRGARMVDFAGFRMPVQYTSIVEEARHVRQRAGIFDLCHMGRVRIGGSGHLEFVDRLVTSDVIGTRVGKVRYGLLTRDDGTIIDDLLVYRDDDATFLCVNAANRLRDLAWLETHAAGTDVIVEDLSEPMAMIALQGPESVAVLRPFCADDPDGLAYYSYTRTDFLGISDCIVSRTGYTGEDGFEICFPAADAATAWNRLLDESPEDALIPIGLAARDTLRLEAGMPLYGHEIDDSTTPVEAGLMWTVRDRGGFVGAEAIREVASRGASRKLIGFFSEGRRVPRHGYQIFLDDQPVGEVVSGTFSPTLERNIGTGFVSDAKVSPEAILCVDLRGDRTPIEIVKPPFYRRAR